MRFVQDDDAVRPQPLLELRQPGLARLRRGDERAVGAEDDAAGGRDGLPYVEVVDLVQRDSYAEVIQVATGRVHQVVVDREPDGAVVALEPVVNDDAGENPP